MRGLKYWFKWVCRTRLNVALYTSAWIEILGGNNVASMRVSRTLHECVDWNTTNRRPYRQMTTSHSTRVRGLKWLTEGCSGRLISVALYTSAWIEIRNGPRYRRSQNVALYTSAWIEISEQTMILCSRNVALYTSAWIEISRIGKKTARIRSHSTRVRGLKLAYFIRQLQLFWFTWEHNLLLDYVPVCNAFVLFYYTLQNK